MADVGPGAAAGRAPSRGRGVLAALALAAVVAVPAGYAALFAAVAFSGCFIECSSPDPDAGVGWAAVALALLSLPVLGGAAAAGAGSRRAWLVVGGVAAALVVGVAVAQRVV